MAALRGKDGRHVRFPIGGFAAFPAMAGVLPLKPLVRKLADDALRGTDSEYTPEEDAKVKEMFDAAAAPYLRAKPT